VVSWKKVTIKKPRGCEVNLLFSVFANALATDRLHLVHINGGEPPLFRAQLFLFELAAQLHLAVIILFL